MSYTSLVDYSDTPQAFLNEVYEVMGYRDGSLINATTIHRYQ